MKVRTTAGAAAVAMAAGGIVLGGAGAASAATSCNSRPLPAVVTGTAAVAAGGAEGVYLYHDHGHWSLRVTHPGTGKAVVTGTITVTRAITHLKKVRLEKGDSVKVSGHGRRIDFRLTNFGKLDGIDFGAECSKDLRMTARINKKGATTDQVFLGSTKAHPTSVPFTVERARTKV